MSMLYLAHNGTVHSNAAESAVHSAANNILWLAASAVAVALIIRTLAGLLSRRQTQEIRREEQDRR